MKVRILMVTLAVALMLGVQGYANPCDCAGVDPCGSCDRFAAKGDLFFGLKRLVNGVRATTHCEPCDGVVACNPCDTVACDPCNTVCDVPRLGLGGRLRNLLATPSCNPCNGAGSCNDVNCDPCNGARNCFDGCGDNYCAPARFTLRGLNPFRNVSLSRGCFADCDPCNGAGNCFDRNCDPCNGAANCFDRNCDPCNGAANCFDRNCDPCNGAANCFDRNCDPCNGACNFDGCGGNYCGPRGHLFDLPRISLSKLFGGVRFARCSATDCGPCDSVQPCNGICCR